MTSFSLCAKLSLSPRETPLSFLTPRQRFPRPREEDTMEGCPGHHMMVSAFHGDCPRGRISWAHRASSNHDTSLHVWDSFSLCHHLYDSDPMAKIRGLSGSYVTFPTELCSFLGSLLSSHLDTRGQSLMFRAEDNPGSSLPCAGREKSPKTEFRERCWTWPWRGRQKEFLKWHFIFIPVVIISNVLGRCLW